MIMRKVMDTMSMTQDITQTNKTLTIKFSTVGPPRVLQHLDHKLHHQHLAEHPR